MQMHKIPIYIANEENVVQLTNSSGAKQYLQAIFKSRLGTQDRYGNKSGTLYFMPRILHAIMDKYDQVLNSGQKVSSFDMWINNTLKTIYFILDADRKTHVYLPDVSGVYLTPIIQQSSSSNISALNYPLTLSQMPLLKSPSTITNNMFEVSICCHGCPSKKERVYLGDDLNLAENGVADLSLDHVVPIREVLESNRKDFSILPKIDMLIRTLLLKYIDSPSSKQDIFNDIKKDIVDTPLINFNDPNALEGLMADLNLIIEKTQGLCVCSKRVNKLSVTK